ncbi:MULTISPECIES: tRNA (guanosine(46)-N7)-methyltransferase TrmB [Aneurinibacillus]|uniref:tRNA (guanine-N(7)-)-methyltransferase n=1 Tax=Aneurinibacillus thermoaerophilus TaxID=143495 RepID=A0A1G7WSD6_ANETH|nr:MULTISPECIES: tRNA (guanosine(46)-N7)-methyltransferase TrmB [Aneurinibacillus]AMA73983.1 tRNA (guanine-N7)-methyltransferase [Aneurinibacillus sp. XH2]MED0676238.1 tRNA (guanosine(46)-N7)-methyltransferase TrmB [Aneurinibacillus thermoaerophilus]MED0737644.1 tRNA (guanosine(46)-N7)-methyltransferase TrmB [Aneurinibacillus thermoaerophilus]MED0755636.1 tRNA (guanosine(46)-N7)-methyltransferase TrmB [Aneurinibacillus thermoaerophilus]MED0760035.1 tRNA (guanosine(46)-N7)-methyltransferase Trm
MRLRKKPGVREAMANYPKLVPQDAEQYKGKWREFFGNNNPIHVELGTGKGNFITTLAEQNPHINYFGVELHEEVLIKAVKKAEEKGLANIAFLWINIRELESYFAPAEVDRFYLNFSDPWPKKRHAKRRLTHNDFLKQYKKLLKAEGCIQLKTDNEGLFEYSLNRFAEELFLLKEITFDLHNSEYAEGNIMTEYEAKFVQKGMKIFRCIAAHPAQLAANFVENE